MAYKTLEVASDPNITLGGHERTKPLPPDVEVILVEAVGNHGYHKDGDRWVAWRIKK
jgi:hypothetical protein